GPIAAEFALGAIDGFGGNRNPHLAWDGVPEGTRSLVLLCIDPDAPTVPETVGREDMEIPVEQPRTEFVHWAMVDIAPAVVAIEAGSCSDRSEEHTSELQSRENLVCRLLLEKKK